MMSFMISIKEHDYVTWLGLICLFEAQLFEMVHKVNTLCPVGIRAVERRHGVHAGLGIFTLRPGVILLPCLWEVNDMGEIIVGMGASL
jgi:hypothetical protein